MTDYRIENSDHIVNVDEMKKTIEKFEAAYTPAQKFYQIMNLEEQVSEAKESIGQNVDQEELWQLLSEEGLENDEGFSIIDKIRLISTMYTGYCRKKSQMNEEQRVSIRACMVVFATNLADNLAALE